MDGLTTMQASQEPAHHSARSNQKQQEGSSCAGVTCGCVRAKNTDRRCQAHLCTQQLGERMDGGGTSGSLHVREHRLCCLQVACTSAAARASELLCACQM